MKYEQEKEIIQMEVIKKNVKEKNKNVRNRQKTTKRLEEVKNTEHELSDDDNNWSVDDYVIVRYKNEVFLVSLKNYNQVGLSLAQCRGINNWKWKPDKISHDNEEMKEKIKPLQEEEI